LIPAYTRGKLRAPNPEYRALYRQLEQARKQEIPDLIQIRHLKQGLRELPSANPIDPDYRRLRFVRYADDFLLAFRGPKKEAEDIRMQISEFLSQKLKLTLSEDKTLITHASDDKAKFLGYEIKVTRQGSLITNGRRASNGGICLLMPQMVVRKYHTK